MSRPLRAVQLAPGSLALVLRRRQEAAGEPSGAALFRAFRRANAGLVRAASRLSLQGWLRGGVLLLRGPAARLQLLRDAWLRGALRPPPGFVIRAAGDVSPVHMNPISQSQCVPLGEILCCAISDMNAAHVLVTQETLMDQLVKHYPGIATPSQEILYSTLGTLIRERKIYHTGEGYFIVTPHTCSITDNVMKDKKKFLLEDNCPLLPSTSYLVSLESCASLKENVLMVSHCRSCHCFASQATFSEQRHQQLINHEHNGRGQKGSGELKPSVQNQPISASLKSHSCDTTKPLTFMKEGEKCKKFGLSLFWRSISKKGKPKKKYSSFSAQFPPEEWPVRDEDNVDNIPRDTEHEIIKHINPVLTVDNLVKHGVLMKKFEEQRKYVSKGTSTKMFTIKQKHISKRCVHKKQNNAEKHHRKVQSDNKEKQISKTQKKSQFNEVMSENDKQEKCAEDLLPYVTNEVIAHEQLYEDATVVESHFIYKKQIKNPFQGLPCREKHSTKGHKGQKNNRCKSRIQKQEWNFQRSGFLDSSRTFDHEAIRSDVQKCGDKTKQNESFHINNSSFQPIKDHYSECSNYLQCTTLRIDDKCKYSRGGRFPDYVYREANEKVIGVVPKTHLSSIEDEFEFKEEIKHSLSSKDTTHCDKPAITCELRDRTSNWFQDVSLSNDPADASQFKQPEKGATQRQNTDTKKELMFNSNSAKWPESVNLEEEGFTEDQTLDKKVDDDHFCSSLSLGEDNSESYHEQLSPSFSETGEWNKVVQQIGTEVSLENWDFPIHPADYSINVSRLDSYGHEVNERHSLLKSIDSSKDSQKITLVGENGFHDQMSQCVDKEEVDLDEHVQASDIDVNIFNFCKTNESNSEAEVLKNALSEKGEKSACWTLGLLTKEVRKIFGEKQQLFNSTHSTILGSTIQQKSSKLQGTEKHSITGDSGIDSPRTLSLTSNTSAILEGLKRRQFSAEL